MTHPNNRVSLAVVAVELATTADELAARLGDAVELDAALVRCIPAGAARDLIATHRAAVQAARDRQRAELEAARQRPHPIHQRVRAIAAAQEKWEGTDVPAIVRLLADDPDSKFNRSSARLDEMWSGKPGELVQHRFQRRTDR